ncbi:hypothetical protein MIMGU_mgv1a021856mg, partial [Erythranthe guttata]
MAGEVVLGAAVQVLLQNLISVSVEQISLVTDFDKHLKRLNDCVSTIHSFLNDAEKKQVTDETVKRWLRKLEGVAFDADNLLDELNYQHLSKKLHTDEYKMRKKILTSLVGTNAELGNKQAVLEELQKHLGTVRFLIVLDDVWNENQEICSSAGNGIIVTTRREHVASLVTTLPIHQLSSFSDDECWSIIKAKAIIGEGTIPSEFETIGVQIAKRCRGLPLAAKVVGGLLRGKSIDGWLSIEKNWLSDFGDENLVSNILKLSFDHLTPPPLVLLPTILKKCFAYCSIFPKGFNLEREKLVELWMAGGFLEGTNMEIVGNNFFNILLQNSLLLQVVGRNDYYGNIMFYNMHDLVHDLASSILNSSEQVRYIGLQSSTSGESRAILNEQAISLRSLLSNDKICVCMFSEFKSLHVLILMGNCVEEFPSSIGVLIHLRCLDISGIRIEYLPDSITELYHLQTFRACHALKKLPNTLEHLMSLRHLHVPQIELPLGIGRLTSLRTLQYFGVSNENGCGIDELGSLKNLQGELQIYNLEKPNIVKLNLEWSIENRKGEKGNESVLEGLEPHPNLKGLYIWGFGGRRLPPWCSTISGLNNLMEITLEDCTDCEQVPMLGHLPNLKNLYLINLENVKSIGSSFYGIVGLT